MVFGKGIITLKPGQFITSRKSLSKKTGIQESKIERLLNVMERDLQIEQQGKSTSRLISIVNWEEYQGLEQQVNSNRTAGEQQVNTNKNEKNVRTEEKTVGAKASPPTAEEIISQYEKDPTYAGINVRVEFGKMVNWCAVKRKHPTKNRFVNWLNRIERPIEGTSHGTNNGISKPNPRNAGIYQNAPGSIGAAVKAQQSLFTKPDGNSA